jgi:hypothetical protein
MRLAILSPVVLAPILCIKAQLCAILFIMQSRAAQSVNQIGATHGFQSYFERG